MKNVEIKIMKGILFILAGIVLITSGMLNIELRINAYIMCFIGGSMVGTRIASLMNRNKQTLWM